MKKQIVLTAAISGLFSLSTFALLTPQSIQAASWHNGIPTALRGKYKSKPRGASRSYTRIYFRKNSAPFYNFWKSDGYTINSPMMGIASHAKYKKVGSRTYKISGRDKSNTITQSMYVYKKGHKIKFTFSHSFKGHPVLYRYY